MDYGPMHEHVVRLIGTVAHLNRRQAGRAAIAASWSARYGTTYATWRAMHCATKAAARHGLTCAQEAAKNAAADAATWPAAEAARHAAWALVVREYLARGHYDRLTLPLREQGVVVHPDDPEV